MPNNPNRENSISSAVVLGWVIFSWLVQFGWFIARIFIGAAIVWGILQSMDLFPIEPLRSLHQAVYESEPTFSGSTLFVWIAAQWIPLALLVLLYRSGRFERSLKSVIATSEHAAMGVSALAKYCSFDITSLSVKRATEAAGKPGYFRALLAEKAYQWVVRIFGGVPFVPQDVRPDRSGEIASLRNDFQEWERAQPIDLPSRNKERPNQADD